MPARLEAVSNTSPLLYLYRLGKAVWLPQLFSNVWAPGAVYRELEEGRRLGYDAPNLDDYPWISVAEPASPPSPALASSLGRGESAVIALAGEHPGCVALLDDGQARKAATTASLTVWGTLRFLLEAKDQGLTDHIAPLLDQLAASGMWLSDDIRNRILLLAGEGGSP